MIPIQPVLLVGAVALFVMGLTRADKGARGEKQAIAPAQPVDEPALPAKPTKPKAASKAVKKENEE